MMNLINSVHNEYNENILSDNWNSSSGISWSATNNVGTLMMEDGTKCYAENKSLKLTCTGYDSSDTVFGPTWLNDLTFVAPRSGKYLFSFRVNLSSGVFDPKPEVTGEFRFIESISAVNTLIPFTLGTNTVPEFTFEYDAWQTFYSEITLVAGGVYKLGACKIFQEGAYSPGVVEMYFAGFKMEYIEDRTFEIPTYYTKPVANDKDLGTYAEAFTTLFVIKNTDKVINFTSNSFSYELPTAVGIKGKIFEIINSGAGAPTLTAFGSETINGAASYVITASTGVRIISDGVSWKILSITNN